MAHELVMINGEASLAYAAGTPIWHGLGQSLEPGADIATWTKQAHLDWTAKESPVIFQTDIGNPPQIVIDKGNKVLWRSDTLTSLAIVSSRYKPVQPSQMLGFFESMISDLGFHLHTAGAIKGGNRIFATAKVGEGFRLFGVDKVDPYLLFGTSFDGSMATFVQYTSTSVVCANTLSVAIHGSTSGKVTVRHVSDFDADSVKAELGLTLKVWTDFKDATETLAGIKQADDQAREFIRNLFDLPTDIEAQEEHANIDAAKKVYQLFNGAGKGSQLPSRKQTAWGLVNAVTEYVDWFKPARSAENHMNSAWFGSGNTLKDQAFTQALKLAA